MSFFLHLLQLFALVFCFGDQVLSPGSSLATDFLVVVPLWQVAQKIFSSPVSVCMHKYLFTLFIYLFHFIYLYRIVEKNIVLIKLRSCWVGWCYALENDNNYVQGKTAQQRA